MYHTVIHNSRCVIPVPLCASVHGILSEEVKNGNQQKAKGTHHKRCRERLNTPGRLRVQGLHENAQPLKKEGRADHGKKVDPCHGRPGHL